MRRSSARRFLRFTLGVAFLCTGAMHFVFTDFMERMIPPALPRPDLLVALSGVAEMTLGAFVFFDTTRVVARWGLLLLLAAVFPANVYMATHPELFPDWDPVMIRWRLPFQALFMLWVWCGTAPRPAHDLGEAGIAS